MFMELLNCIFGIELKIEFLEDIISKQQLSINPASLDFI